MKPYLFLLLVYFPCAAASQASKNPKEAFFVWDKEWRPTTNTDSAAYFGRRIFVNDTTWQWDVYNYTGPKISSQHFRDENLQEANGRHIFYNSAGYIDSMGTVSKGRVHGEWYYHNDTGRAIMVKVYNYGKLISSEVLGKKAEGENELLEEGGDESTFPGGLMKWKQYLQKNMTYPDRAEGANIGGVVIIGFEVDLEGAIRNPEIHKSVEYSLDEQALGLIRKSPRWIPGKKDGQLVRTFKKQPIAFSLR